MKVIILMWSQLEWKLDI